MRCDVLPPRSTVPDAAVGTCRAGATRRRTFGRSTFLRREGIPCQCRTSAHGRRSSHPSDWQAAPCRGLARGLTGLTSGAVML